MRRIGIELYDVIRDHTVAGDCRLLSDKYFNCQNAGVLVTDFIIDVFEEHQRYRH